MTDVNIDGIVTWLSNWFQDKLVSGTNIKTINNQSILGSGNISVSGGGLSIDDVYPVGSIYMSVNSTSPQTLFGGTWQQLTDTFLYATSTTADTGTTATSGSADAVIVEHNHTQNNHSHNMSDSSYYFVGKTSSSSASTKRVTVPTSGSNYAYVGASGAFANFGATDTKTPTINNTGESGTGKNMPPYMKVYMWKRTA